MRLAYQPWHCDNALLVLFLLSDMSMQSMQKNAVLSFFPPRIAIKRNDGSLLIATQEKTVKYKMFTRLYRTKIIKNATKVD